MDYLDRLKDVLLGCTSCLQSTSTITLNGRRFKVGGERGEEQPGAWAGERGRGPAVGWAGRAETASELTASPTSPMLPLAIP